MVEIKGWRRWRNLRNGGMTERRDGEDRGMAEIEGW